MTEGEQFIHEKDPSLHTTKPVERAMARKGQRGESISEKPDKKIGAYFERFEEILNPEPLTGHPNFDRKERNINLLFRKLFDEAIIKPENITQSYWNSRAKIMINDSYGGDMKRAGVKEETYLDSEGRERVNYIFPDELKQQEIDVIIGDQQRSLKKWVDYLTSPDATYPMWAKYWAFRSILNMGKFEKIETKEGEKQASAERARFQKRTPDTVASFPLLNPRALAKTIGVMTKHLDQKSLPKKDRQPLANESERLNDEEFQKLLSTEKFANLYAQFLIDMPEYSTEGLENIEGKWVRYPQGDDPEEVDRLVESLEGHPLEWCTADRDTATTQLRGGDFYVYYSNNDLGEAKIPRLAIRMEGKTKIAEPPRGIAPKQNLDPYIAPVLEEKLKDFGEEGELYKQRIADVKRLTDIWERNEKKETLTKEDLRFLYEIDDKIQQFGYERDPRIEEILQGRDIRGDLVLATDFQADQISLTDEEALSGNIKFHYGDLRLNSLKSAEGLKLPDSVGGDLYLGSLTSAEGLNLPDSVGEHLVLSSLTSTVGLTLPDSIGGGLYLGSLTSAEGLTLPDSIGGGLYLRNLTSAEGLKLPDSVGGDLDLNRLTSAVGLTLPDSIGGDLYLSSLKSAEGLTLPDSIGGNLSLRNLTSAEGLTLPASIGGGLYLYSLTSAEKEVLRRQYPDLEIH